MRRRTPASVFFGIILLASASYAPPVHAAGLSSVPATLGGYFTGALNFIVGFFNASPVAPTPLPSKPTPVVTHETAPPSTTTAIAKTVYLTTTSSALTISGVTEAELTQKLAGLETRLKGRINSRPAVYSDVGPTRINNLSFENLTVNGVTGLTDADIPSLSSLYVSVAGSTITGLTSFANASTTLFSAYGPAYFGATATSTFGADGSLTLASALTVANGGTGTTTWQTGSIPFFNGTRLTENNSNLFWDNTNHRLGIASTSPATILSVAGDGYFTGGLGVGVENTTSGTLQTSGDATIGGALAVGNTNAALFGQAVNSFGGLQFAAAQGGLSTPTNAGSGYAAGDTITLSCTGITFATPLVVGVTAVSGSAVADATVSQPGVTSGAVPSGSVSCTQSSTSGSGAGYAATVQFGVIASYLSVGGLATGGSANNGNLIINNVGIEGGTGNSQFAGGESTFFGDKAGAGIIGNVGSVTAVGHNACGNGGTGGTTTGGIVCIGTDAGRNLQGSVGSSVVIGYGAGRNLAVANTILIGAGAGGSSGSNSPGTLTGVNNIGIGVNAFKVLTTGGNNVAIGTPAMQALVNGAGNTGVGLNVLNAIVSATDNTAVGQNAGQNLTGNQNVIIGSKAATASGGAGRNTIIGYQAGSVLTGNNNIFFGWNAASTTATGSNNIALGYDIALPSTNGSNQLDIGNLIFGTGINGEGTTLSTGSVGIGTSTPWRTLDVNGTVGFKGLTSVGSNQTAYLCLSANNEVVQDSTTCLASSARFKQDIAPLSASSSLAEIMQLTPVSFKYTPAYNGALQSDPNFNGTFVGFIAEDVAKIDPRLTTVDSVGTTPMAAHGVRYENITAILAGAIQEMAAISGAFRDNLIAWLADASNGIGKLFAGEIDTPNLCVTDSTGAKTCITKAQLDALLAGQHISGQVAQPPAGQASFTSTTPPTATTTPSTDAAITTGTLTDATTTTDRTQPPPPAQVASPAPDATTTPS